MQTPTAATLELLALSDLLHQPRCSDAPQVIDAALRHRPSAITCCVAQQGGLLQQVAEGHELEM